MKKAPERERLLREGEIFDLILSKAPYDGAFAVAYAVLRLAEAQQALVKEVNALGFKDAATPLGALEHVSEDLQGVAKALGEIAEAISAAVSTDD